MSTDKFLRGIARTNSDRFAHNRARAKVKSTWDIYKAAKQPEREAAYADHVQAQNEFNRLSINVGVRG